MRRLEVTALALNPKQGRKGEAQRHRQEKKVRRWAQPCWPQLEAQRRKGEERPNRGETTGAGVWDLASAARNLGPLMQVAAKIGSYCGMRHFASFKCGMKVD